MEHPFFGTLDPGGVEWNDVAEVGGHRVVLELTCNAAVSTPQLDVVATFARDVERLDEMARAALREDHDAVALYVSHHLEQLTSDELRALFGTGGPDGITASQFLERVVLVHVVLYPESRTQAAVFDYTLGRELTQYVLAVSFGADGAVTGIEMES
jgi:hypothetical protein